MIKLFVMLAATLLFKGPFTNTDSTPLTDLSHFVVRYYPGVTTLPVDSQDVQYIIAEVAADDPAPIAAVQYRIFSHVLSAKQIGLVSVEAKNLAGVSSTPTLLIVDPKQPDSVVEVSVETGKK